MTLAPQTLPPATAVPKARTAAILTLVLVFLLGMMVGAVAMNIAEPHHALRTGSLADKRTPITLDRWKKALNLTDSQSKQMEEILDDFSKYYDNVLADGNTRILQILDPEQRVKFQKMLQDGNK